MINNLQNLERLSLLYIFIQIKYTANFIGNCILIWYTVAIVNIKSLILFNNMQNCINNCNQIIIVFKVINADLFWREKKYNYN